MKFGIFYEHQLPKPWDEGVELKLFQDALDQVELADRLGIDYAWEVEHHFLEEYSHSSAPEIFLAAASQRTKNIRLGHGIRQVITNYNHPARTAECIATLDLVSNGRVDFGTGESSAILELGGFNIPVESKRAWKPPSRSPICWRWIPTLGTRVSISPCRAATSCRNRSRSRTHRCGSPAPTARRSRWPHASALAR